VRACLKRSKNDANDAAAIAAVALANKIARMASAIMVRGERIQGAKTVADGMRHASRQIGNTPIGEGMTT
jgi:hypothetical protein